MEGKQGCCFRCEYRAKYLETGHGPRAECKSVEMNYVGCYMYRPVMPVVMAMNEYEKEIEKKYGVVRPAFGPGMISARMHFIRLPEEEMRLAVRKVEKGLVLYWEFKGDKE